MAKKRKNKSRVRAKGEVIAQGVKTPKSPEVKYRRELNLLVRSLNKTVKTRLVPALLSLEREYTADGYAEDLGKVMDSMELEFRLLDVQSKILASQFVISVQQANKERFKRAIGNSMGIDMSMMLKQEDLTDVVQSATRANVKLINSIPQRYFAEIEQIVYNGTTQGNSSKSMIDQILGVKDKAGQSTTSKKAFNSAKLIARDQTAKLNANLSQTRQERLNIVEYQWLTSDDERVRESHKANNRKIFRWDSPPNSTGHPGNDINCRCIAKPIINI